MKSKTKFLKMYYKLPQMARDELVYNFSVYPMSLRVCKAEIQNDTALGNKILGYEDETNTHH